MIRRIIKEFRENSAYSIAFVLIAAIGIGLRLHYIAQPIRYDEALTFLKYASLPLTDVISLYEEPNNHIFHSVLVHISYRLFGNEVWALRLPALIAGVLTLPALYVVTARLYNRSAALLATALAAVSMSLVEFSVLARGYSIITLLFVVLIGLAITLRQSANMWKWLLFAILGALGFYTIPVMLYPMGVVSIWLLLSILRDTGSVGKTKLLLSFIAAHIVMGALTLLLYMPVLQREGLDALIGNEFVTQLKGQIFFSELGTILNTAIQFPFRGFPAFVPTLILLGAGLAWLVHRRLGKGKVALALAILVWLIPIVLLQRVNPFDRNWLFLAPAYFMIGSAGLAVLISWWRPVFLVGTLGLAVFFALQLVSSGAILVSEQVGNVPDAEHVARFVGEVAEAGDEILAPIPIDAPLEYYLTYHRYPPVTVRNQYHTSWVDLRDPSREHYFLVTENNTNVSEAFLEIFQLATPEFAMRLRPLRDFQQLTLQQIIIPPFPSGVLYQADFDSWGTEGMQFNGIQVVENPRLLNQHLELTTEDEWGEMVLTGGNHWSDYAFEARVQVLRSTAEFADIYFDLRYLPQVGHYTGSLDIDAQHSQINAENGDNVTQVLEENPLPLEVNRWYSLRFEAIEDELRLLVDGSPVITVEDSRFTQGTVRLLMPPNTTIRIDDLQVLELTVSEPASDEPVPITANF